MSARGLSPMTLRSHVTALSYPATVAHLIGVRFFLLRMRPARISLSHQSACSLNVVKLSGPDRTETCRHIKPHLNRKSPTPRLRFVAIRNRAGYEWAM